MKYAYAWIVAMALFATPINFACASGDQDNSIINDLDRLISQGESAPYTGFDAIREKIEANPDRFLPLLLAKANTPNLPEANLAVYIWALGLTKSPKAVDTIIRLSIGKKTDLLLGNVYRALAAIGDEKSGAHLFQRMKETSNSAKKYILLDFLAQIHYRPALPYTIEILKQDSKGYYRQCMFIFGKYGDTAIPFLLERLGDADRNIRLNSILILGPWLMAPEAASPMKRQYPVEHSPDIRLMILSSLEKVANDLTDVRAFFEQVAKTETNQRIVEFAQETMANLEKLDARAKSFRASKKDNRSLFESEYRQIYNSYGKTGNYDNLAATSTRSDEPRMKKLRETILQRNSEDCFFDYQRVNDIIMLNRIL